MELHKGSKLTLTPKEVEQLVIDHCNAVMRNEGYNCDEVNLKVKSAFPAVTVYGESSIENKVI